MAKLQHHFPHSLSNLQQVYQLLQVICGTGQNLHHLLKEQNIGLYTLCIEDARWQSQDGVEVALVHKVGSYLLANIVFEENIVGEYHRCSSAWLEVSIDVLEEGKLLIIGLEGKITAFGTFSF